jgi:hypothetical protein
MPECEKLFSESGGSAHKPREMRQKPAAWELNTNHRSTRIGKAGSRNYQGRREAEPGIGKPNQIGAFEGEEEERTERSLTERSGPLYLSVLHLSGFAVLHFAYLAGLRWAASQLQQDPKRRRRRQLEQPPIEPETDQQDNRSGAADSGGVQRPVAEV